MIGEYLRVIELEFQGYNVTTQVLYQDPTTGLKSFVDITAYRDVPVTDDSAQRYYLFEEIKTGNGVMTNNQIAVMGAISDGIAIPLGPRSTFAQLTPGVSLIDQGVRPINPLTPK